MQVGRFSDGERMSRQEQDRAFCDFVAARSRALLRTAYLLTGDHQATEDLVQTALTKTYLAWGGIHDKGAVEGYVRQTIVTTYTSWWRRRWRGEVPTDVLPETSYDGVLGDSDERSRIWHHLRALPARQRAVVVLRYYEDLPEVEIARLLGCSAGTVKSQAHRALTTLRLRLGEENDSEYAPGGAS